MSNIKKLTYGLLAGLVMVGLVQAIAPRQVAGSTVKQLSSPTLSVPTSNVVVKSATKNVVQLNLDPSRVVFILGPIFDTSAVVGQIYAMDKVSHTKRIAILLSSPGGSVLEGAKVINAIEGVTAPVDTICTELCASEAAVIHSYGAIRYMTDRSFLMYHDFSGGFQGEGAHMHSLMTAIERFVQRSNVHIAERARLPLETFENSMLKQIWVDSEDATERSFNDTIASIDIEGLLPKDATNNAILREQLKHATDEYDNLRDAK